MRQHNFSSTAGQRCCFSCKTSGRQEEGRAAIRRHSLPFRGAQVSNGSAKCGFYKRRQRPKLPTAAGHNTWLSRTLLSDSLWVKFIRKSSMCDSALLISASSPRDWKQRHGNKPSTAKKITTTGSRQRKGEALNFSEEKKMTERVSLSVSLLYKEYHWWTNHIFNIILAVSIVAPKTTKKQNWKPALSIDREISKCDPGWSRTVRTQHADTDVRVKAAALAGGAEPKPWQPS